MAIDVSHVSFLGFEALLARLEADGLAAAPTDRSVWLAVDTRGLQTGRCQVVVQREARTWTFDVEERVEARGGGHLLRRGTAITTSSAPCELKEWSVSAVVRTAQNEPLVRTQRTAAGRVKGGRLQWAGGAGPQPLTSGEPVCLDWSLPFLAEHDATLDLPPTRRFHLLEGGWSLASAVTWSPIGRVTLWGHALRGWRVFGPDVPLRHFWTGPGGSAMMELGAGAARVRASLLGHRE